MAERQDQNRPSPAQPDHDAVPDTGGHGHSVAAWTAVGTIMAGSLVACLAVVLALVWLFVVGVVVIVVGAVLGKVLHGMGFGETAHDEASTSSNQGVR